MIFLDFVYGQSMDFWRSESVQMIVSICIVFSFLHFTRSLSSRWTKRVSLILTCCIFTVSCLIYLNYFAIAQHNLMIGVAFFIYLTLSRDINYRNAMVLTALHVSLVEFSTTLIKDGLFSPLAVALPLSFLNPLVKNIIILVFWMISILMLSHFCEPVFRNYKDLPLKIYHVVIMLLPTCLFIFLRDTKFYLFTTEPENSDLLLRIHVTELAICFIYLSIAYVLIQLVSANMENAERYRHELLLSQQEEQYRIKLEVIDAVNRRYHDLKNFVFGMDLADKQLLIDEMKPFETIIETGNRVLNMIISDKIRECQKYDIRMTPFVNGKSVSFISDLDICSLFGNILDNAIEAAKHTSNPEIYLKVDISDTFLIIIEQNPFLHEPVIRNGKMISSKQEEGHGYGMYNIERVLKHYDGTMSCSIHNRIFELSILIPVADNR